MQNDTRGGTKTQHHENYKQRTDKKYGPLLKERRAKE